MNNSFPEFQLHDGEYFFLISMSHKISFSSSLSHITKVNEYFKFAMQSSKAALPSEDIDDSSAVLRCTAADSSLVL